MNESNRAFQSAWHEIGRAALVTRVLIADDDEAIRKLLRKLLTMNNIEVEEASDGEMALEMLREGDFDAMLLDLMMPRKNGFDVVDELRTTDPAFLPHVVVVSAFPNRAFEVLGDACRVVSKPFEIHKLIEVIHECAAAS